jgi:hypothetical protein
VNTGKQKKPGDASMKPVLISIVLLPGLGQWMQRRYNAGTFYMAGFLTLALMFAVIVIDHVRDGKAMDAGIYKPLGAVLFVYFANVIDILRGRLQLRKKETRAD